MINLLPPKNKEKLLEERNWKIVMILGTNLLLILVCFSLILYATSALISGEIKSHKIIYQQREREFKSPKMQTLERNLTNFNQIFSRLDCFYQNRFEATETLKEISETIPPEIYLTNLLINPNIENDKTAECTLAGFSPERESLLGLKENLEEKGNFEEIYFPPASWVRPTDIDFTVNFKINLR